MDNKNEFTELTPLPETETRSDAEQSDQVSNPVEEEPKKPGGFLYHLFSPETRLGRFMRPVVRAAALIVILFTFGFLSAYLLLYQPRLEEMNRTQENLKTTTLKLSQTEGTLTAAQKYITELNDKYQQASADLVLEKNHSSLLQLRSEINNARYALAKKDGASARLILQNARKLMDGYLPVIKAHSSEMAASFDTRLTLVMNEFSRDPETALTDLNLLSSNLVDLEKVLYK